MELFVNLTPLVLVSVAGTALTLVMAYWRGRLAHAYRARQRQ